MTNDTKEPLETLQNIAARNRPERQRERYSVRKSIEAIKAEVSVDRYASEFTQLKRHGKSLRGTCPLHNGDSDSFAVYPEAGRWYCYRCNTGGDVLALCKAVEDHASLWTALVSLSQRYAVELPQRPEIWHRRQDEKDKFRKALCRRLTEKRVRRYYRVFAPAFLEDCVDEEDRKERSEDLWESLWSVLYASTMKRLEGEYV